MNAEQRQTAADRLAERLRTQLHDVLGPPGSRIPPIRQVARDHHVSVNTAMYALRQLEQEGLIERRPNSMGVVAEKPATGKPDPADRHARGWQPAPNPSLDHPHRVAVIGPLTPRIDYIWDDHWGARILTVAEQALYETGHCLPIRAGSMHPDPDRAIDQIIEQVQAMADQLAGVLVPCGASTLAHRRLLSLCEALKLPCVAINRPTHQFTHNFIGADNLLAGRVAGRMCMDLGYENVLVLSRAQLEKPSASEKAMGLALAYWQAGRQSHGIAVRACGHRTQQSGYATTRAYLQEHGPPQAIFATGDMLAIGGMRACFDAGHKVPDDVAVIGSTGLDEAEFVSPSLAVIEQPMHQMGAEAARMLISLIESGEMHVHGRFIPCPVTVRESVPITQARADHIYEQELAMCSQHAPDAPTTGSKANAE
ncbi:MAG: substrate-binding domain-containing protein [bacterium]